MLTLIKIWLLHCEEQELCAEINTQDLVQNISAETPTQSLRRTPNEGYWSIVLLRNNIIDILDLNRWFQNKRDSLYRSLVKSFLFLTFKLKHWVQMLPCFKKTLIYLSRDLYLCLTLSSFRQIWSYTLQSLESDSFHSWALWNEGCHSTCLSLKILFCKVVLIMPISQICW